MITYDDFAKGEIKVGKILSAEPIPNSTKLLKLSVDFAETAPVAAVEPGVVAASAGPRVPRTILSGIAKYYPDCQVLVGKKCMFVTNLEPRPMMGMESNGMLFAVSTEDGKFSLLEPGADIPEGTKAK
jgi:methionyl-tRNA synthetase